MVAQGVFVPQDGGVAACADIGYASFGVVVGTEHKLFLGAKIHKNGHPPPSDRFLCCGGGKN